MRQRLLDVSTTANLLLQIHRGTVQRDGPVSKSQLSTSRIRFQPKSLRGGLRMYDNGVRMVELSGLLCLPINKGRGA
jgi:hypothetical protein